MARIGIVGAGPGGLSLARLLQDRGHTDFVIFERTDRVGGKSFSYNYLGLAHELGTCYLIANYVHVFPWMEEFGIGLFPLKKHLLVQPDGTVTDFIDYVQQGSKLRTFWQMFRYSLDWMIFYISERTGWGRKRFNRDVARSYGHWLRHRGYDAIERFALRAVTVMGYGALSKVPALAGLRWNTPGLLFGAASIDAFEPCLGWGGMWAGMAAAGNMDIRLGTSVLRAARQGSGYSIETQGSDGSRKTEQVEHLVITTPLDECAPWFDLPPAAQEIAKSVVWKDYVTTLVVAEGWFRDSDTRCFEAHAMAAEGADIGHMIVARRTGDKVPDLPPGRPDVYVTYQYAEPAFSNEKMLEILKQDIAADGGRVTHVEIQKRWKYSPELTHDAIRAGAVWKMRDLQGHDNLWFSGASFSHESVVNIVNFNEDLVAQILRAQGSDYQTP